MKGNNMLRIFIGYDSREHVPYEVCKHSVRRHASSPLDIIKLEHRDLRRKGLFDRPWSIQGNGQYHDTTDGKPYPLSSFEKYYGPIKGLILWEQSIIYTL